MQQQQAHGNLSYKPMPSQLTRHHMDFSNDQVKRVNRISFIQKNEEDLISSMKEQTVVKKAENLKVDMEDLEFDNKIYELQDKMHDANKQLRTQKIQREAIGDHMIDLELKVRHENQLTSNLVMDHIADLRANLQKFIAEEQN